MVSIIKLRSTGRKLTPYIGTAVTDGKQQLWFKEHIGIPVGNCVKSAVKKGMSIGAIHKAVRDCAKSRGKATAK